MTATLFENTSVLDVTRGTLVPDQAVLVDGGLITEVGPAGSVHSAEARVLDLRGKTLMPGLIDCHVHVTAATAHLAEMTEWSPTYVAAHASAILRGMLDRGFTTVRDVGGADFGLAQALADGLFVGPRLVFGGHSLSQTGGHGDSRSRGRTALEPGYHYAGLGRVCDGVDDVRTASTARNSQRMRFVLQSTRPLPPTFTYSGMRTRRGPSTGRSSLACAASSMAT